MRPLRSVVGEQSSDPQHGQQQRGHGETNQQHDNRLERFGRHHATNSERATLPDQADTRQRILNKGLTGSEQAWRRRVARLLIRIPP